MIKLSYEEIGKGLLTVDESYSEIEEDPIKCVENLTSGYREKIVKNYLKKNGFLFDDKKKIMNINPDGLAAVKAMTKEILDAYALLFKRSKKAKEEAYKVFRKWGVEKCGDDSIIFDNTGDIDNLILGIEHCLNAKKKVA